VAHQKHKMKIIGNMKFVAQIIEQKWLPFKTAISISKELLEDGSEDSLEALCAFWTKVRRARHVISMSSVGRVLCAKKFGQQNLHCAKKIEKESQASFRARVRKQFPTSNQIYHYERIQFPTRLAIC
jgi:hypothetical protein